MLNRLISSLGVLGKILTLLGLFMIPLLLLGYSYLMSIQELLDTSRSELKGVLEIRPIFEDALKLGDHTSIITAEEKIERIRKESKLALDSEYESYYLQEIISTYLPEISEHLSNGASANATENTRIENSGILRMDRLPGFYQSLTDVKQILEISTNKNLELVKSITATIEDRNNLETILMKAIGGSRDDYLKACNALRQVALNVSIALEKILEARIYKLEFERLSAWTTTIVALIILLLVSCLIVRNITGRLANLFKATIKATETGDLSQSVMDQGRDEIFNLSQSFNAMIKNLRTMVTKVSHSGSLISTSTAEIAAVSKQQQATSSEIAATTSQIEATSKQIADTSESLSKSMFAVQETASETAELASEGQEGLERMRQTMHGITDACAGISSKLETLNQRAVKIGDVVVTIAKVADQTNLLSLNAAIEAEKAGEFGHGFSVVAREIRRLADQTAASTLDIEQMVKEIQGAVAAGVMGMEKFSSEVRRGATEVEGTSTQLSTIISQIQTLSPTFQSVSEGMKSQVLGAKQITEGLSQLSTAARQTADSLSQSNLSIEQLHQASLLLEGEVAKFQLGGQH